MKKNREIRILSVCLFVGILLCACSGTVRSEHTESGHTESSSFLDTEETDFGIGSPDVGTPYIEVNGNRPFFGEEEYTCEAFETYAPLDELGRCGAAYANICEDIMPKEERGEIGSVRPSGWHTVKYSGVIDGNYLYNRCHLIAFALAGENANEKNLITGTRYMNVEGMLPFENQVANYVKRTGNHVLYRVTPVFSGENLVADGVLMEAYSVEDAGSGIQFCVFVYNVQPGIVIEYATGESRLDENADTGKEQASADYVLNTNTRRFHDPSCQSVDTIKAGNRQDFYGSKDAVLDMGYTPCGNCNP